MLAANEAVAEMLRDRGLWFLRRDPQVAFAAEAQGA